MIMHYVLDTSFVVDGGNKNLWAVDAMIALKNGDCIGVVPYHASREFVHLLKKGKVIVPGKKKQTSKEEQEGSKAQFIEYNEKLRPEFSLRLEREQDYFEGSERIKSEPLSVADKTVIQAAYDLAKRGEQVIVATADHRIVYKVHQIELEDKLSIGTCSPWSTPLKRDYIRMLATERALNKMQFSDFPSVPVYLAIASKMDVGRGIKYDIVFSVYTDKHDSIVLPRANGVEYLRLIQKPEGSIPMKDARAMLTAKEFAWYDIQEPGNFTLLEQVQPLSLLEMQEISRRIKNISRKDAEKMLERIVSKRQIFHNQWARIEMANIALHCRPTEGKIDQLEKLVNNNFRR